tara:strand:- start:271 stop:708 length:438 start_codon:yes stop_codon:yes gene_type:complete
MIKLSNNWKPLKLKAIDDNDLVVFSECIYQAILLPTEIDYDPKEDKFAMAIERFTWEIASGKDYNLMQVQSVLIINGVKKIETKNYFKKNSIGHLISISNVDNNILILLNNDLIINLKVDKWQCILRDMGTPFFPATTPAHFRND